MQTLVARLFSWFTFGTAPNGPKFINKGELARLFGVTPDIIDMWVKDGKLPKGQRRFGRQQWEYRKVARLRKSRKPW